jgi:hypothetical protein
MVKVQAREKVATRRRWREGNMAVAWLGSGRDYAEKMQRSSGVGTKQVPSVSKRRLRSNGLDFLLRRKHTSAIIINKGGCFKKKHIVGFQGE